MHGVGGVHGGGHAWLVGVHGQGVCVAGECAWWGSVHGRGCAWLRRCAWQGECVAGETATAADGTHPTGMHSCLPLRYSLNAADFLLAVSLTQTQPRNSIWTTQNPRRGVCVEGGGGWRGMLVHRCVDPHCVVQSKTSRYLPLVGVDDILFIPCSLTTRKHWSWPWYCRHERSQVGLHLLKWDEILTDAMVK